MKQAFSSILLIALAQFAFSQAPPSSEIAGKIIGATEQHIKIGDDEVPVAADGTFLFKSTAPYANFVDVQYGTVSWSVYLEPGKRLELQVTSFDLSSLVYRGELAGANACLKNISLLQPGTNGFFADNWVRIHSQDEIAFVALIDSFKNEYRGTLTAYQKEHGNIPGLFVTLLNADIDFGFNALIVDFPTLHQRFTGRQSTLSRQAMDYLASSHLDDTTVMHLSSFQKYGKKWIDYNADILVGKSTGRKHYNLKKMDLLPVVLSSTFKTTTLRDYWFSEYLREQIENTGIANTETYMKEFDRVCETATFRKKIDTLYASYAGAEKDHVVKNFKKVNGFVLNAHMFYPADFEPGQKRSVIVIFHGGGFVLGNPSWAYGKAKHYASKGMIAVAAQYRLCNLKDVTPIDAIDDAKDLIRWLRANADSLGINADKVAASGWSMGAQLCASLAVFADTLPGTKISCSPNALLLTSPGTNARGWFAELLNGAKVNPQDYSPVDHVRPGLPPAIILQGRDDTVTPLQDVQLFHDTLISAGNTCEMWIYEHVGHLFTPTSLGDSGWPRPDPEVQKKADEKSDEFLSRLGYKDN